MNVKVAGDALKVDGGVVRGTEGEEKSMLKPDPEALLTLVDLKMPFGKYAGRAILDMPEAYLLWFKEKGFPQGKLGEVMALAYEVKLNGLEPLIRDAIKAHRAS